MRGIDYGTMMMNDGAVGCWLGMRRSFRDRLLAKYRNSNCEGKSKNSDIKEMSAQIRGPPWLLKALASCAAHDIRIDHGAQIDGNIRTLNILIGHPVHASRITLWFFTAVDKDVTVPAMCVNY